MSATSEVFNMVLISRVINLCEHSTYVTGTELELSSVTTMVINFSKASRLEELRARACSARSVGRQQL